MQIQHYKYKSRTKEGNNKHKEFIIYSFNTITFFHLTMNHKSSSLSYETLGTATLARLVSTRHGR